MKRDRRRILSLRTDRTFSPSNADIVASVSTGTVSLARANRRSNSLLDHRAYTTRVARLFDDFHEVPMFLPRPEVINDQTRSVANKYSGETINSTVLREWAMWKFL